MMVVYRIATDTPDFTADDLSGTGARITGGRWNRPGTPLVYAASSRALACLETVVHLGVGDLPLNRYVVEIRIPDAVFAAAVRFDPVRHVGWDAIPEGMVSIDAGEAWVASAASALMLVPSVIVPEEDNVLVNPRHPDARALRAVKMRRWLYDGRLRDAAARPQKRR